MVEVNMKEEGERESTAAVLCRRVDCVSMCFAMRATRTGGQRNLWEITDWLVSLTAIVEKPVKLCCVPSVDSWGQGVASAHRVFHRRGTDSEWVTVLFGLTAQVVCREIAAVATKDIHLLCASGASLGFRWRDGVDAMVRMQWGCREASFSFLRRTFLSTHRRHHVEVEARRRPNFIFR